jgi:hypothetical protein
MRPLSRLNKLPQQVIVFCLRRIRDANLFTPHVTLHYDLPCRQCFGYSSRPLACKAGCDYACIRNLTVDHVLRLVHQLHTQEAWK